MPTNQAFDSGELKTMVVPYDVSSSDLSPDVRLVAGSNMLVTNFGKLIKRPGTTDSGLGRVSDAVQNMWIENAISYETLDNPPKRWTVASVGFGTTYPPTNWLPYATSDSFGTHLLTELTNLRAIQVSRYPHEFVVSRGLCFIRATPISAQNAYGTVVFNGSNGTLAFWGLGGPTAPAAMTASGGWTASTYAVTVNLGWYYTYTYKTITGQESNRAPLQTDPSKASSSTGAFTNKCPQMTLTGNSDTTNVPTIVIYRSTDGGGTFYKVEEISNVSGSITYNDRHFNDGLATPAQPWPDSALDTTLIAPTLVSNSPPPTVMASDTAIATVNGAMNNSTTTLTVNNTFNSQAFSATSFSTTLYMTLTVDSEQMLATAAPSAVTFTVTRGYNGTVAAAHADLATVRWTPLIGADSSQQSTPIAAYAGRLWYAIGNVLYYSGQEEITAGVPEECWPSGLRGNFFRFNKPIVNVHATSEALYVIGTDETSWVRGTTKDTFQVQKLFDDIGGRPGHPRACCAADKSLVWLTQDLRLIMARGFKREFLSDPLGTSLQTAVITNGCKVHLCRYAEYERDLIVVLATKPADMTKAQQWVYDFNQIEGGSWSTPWTGPWTTAWPGFIASDTTTASKPRYLMTGGAALVSGVLQGSIGLLDMTLATVQDSMNTSNGITATDYACGFTVSQVRNPAGNHVNALRLPGTTSVLHAVKLDRTKFTSDTDPTLTAFFDNITNTGGTVFTPETDPPRRDQSTGFTTSWYEVDRNCENVSVAFAKSAANERFEAQRLAFVWNPEAGA